MKKLLFVGNSHVAAIRRGAEKLDKNEIDAVCMHLREAIYEGCYDNVSGKFSGKLVEDIKSKIDGGYTIFSCIGGNAYNVLGLVDSDRPFDFMFEDSQIDPSREMIPHDIIRSAILRRDREYLRQICAIAGFASVRHVFAPPPIESCSYIIEHAESAFRNLGVDNFGVTPAPVRLKLWKLQCEVQKDTLQEHGVGVMYPPKITRDDNGYLLESMAAKDASHGNTLYGKHIVLECASSIEG